ncbi:Purine-cytosine permease fcy21 [Collariella sp. IMI 366227]|nr:Purine-cytosine permease fcy21 [Collariella sp. IMI 366227]
MSKAKRETDIESSPVELHQISDKSLDTAVLKIVSGQDVVHNDDFGTGDSLLARFQRFAGSYGMEQRGIEWVPLDEREDTPPYRIGVLWFSASTSVPTFALGALAVPGFGLGFVDSMLIIVLMNALGAVPVAIFCSWGPKFGLRQMILTRFFFGYYVAKFRRS